MQEGIDRRSYLKYHHDFIRVAEQEIRGCLIDYHNVPTPMAAALIKYRLRNHSRYSKYTISAIKTALSVAVKLRAFPKLVYRAGNCGGFLLTKNQVTKIKTRKNVKANNKIETALLVLTEAGFKVTIEAAKK